MFLYIYLKLMTHLIIVYMCWYPDSHCYSLIFFHFFDNFLKNNINKSHNERKKKKKKEQKLEKRVEQPTDGVISFHDDKKKNYKTYIFEE